MSQQVPTGIGVIVVLVGALIVYAVIFNIQGGCAFIAPASHSITKATNYTIEVSGTVGLRFTGSYMVVQPDGSSVSKSVEGVVPATYLACGSMVSVAFCKVEEAGTLKIILTRAGSDSSSTQTSAPYGLASVCK